MNMLIKHSLINLHLLCLDNSLSTFLLFVLFLIISLEKLNLRIKFNIIIEIYDYIFIDIY